MPTNTLYGYTDSNAKPLQIEVPNLNYNADFAVASNAGTSAILVNKTTPVNQKETLRFSIQDISNVYSGTDVDPTLYAPSKKGKSVVCQVADTAIVTTSTGEKVAYPVEAHVVVRFPLTNDLSTDDIFAVAKRAVGAMFDVTDAAQTSTNSYYEYDEATSTWVNKGNAQLIHKESARINEIFRGAVNPCQ